MNVNIKNAAKNAYEGMKSLSSVIDDHDAYCNLDDFVASLEQVLVEYQPLLAAYCVYEELSDADSPRAQHLEKTFEHIFVSGETCSDTCQECGLNIRDGVHIRY